MSPKRKPLELKWWDKTQPTETEKLQTNNFEGVEDALQFLLSVVDTMTDEAPWKSMLVRGPDGVWRPK
jgi:hypothetical protein